MERRAGDEADRTAKPHPDTAESYNLLWYFVAVFVIAAFSALRWRPEPGVIGAVTGMTGAVTAGVYATALGLSGRRQRLAAYGFQYGMILLAVASAGFMASIAGGLAAAATFLGVIVALWIGMRLLPVRPQVD